MTLSHARAREFYDRFGAKQDLQRFYEDRAIDALLAHANMPAATSVFELGCGTGRLAERLLRNYLSAQASYVGVDVSSTMIELAGRRVQPWAGRAEVRQTSGSLRLDLPEASIDRFVSTYVLDLLSDDDIATLLAEARRMLVRGGLLCLASLSTGTTRWSRAVSRAWAAIHARRPMWVGGCRPLELGDYLAGWRVRYHDKVRSLGITTEVVVAD